MEFQPEVVPVLLKIWVAWAVELKLSSNEAAIDWNRILGTIKGTIQGSVSFYNLLLIIVREAWRNTSSFICVPFLCSVYVKLMVGPLDVASDNVLVKEVGVHVAIYRFNYEIK
jgi:hypothetical protein